MNAKLSFNKRERLKSRKAIEHLFSSGKAMSAHPLKVLYDFVEDTSPLTAGVTASRKSFKKAVERNRVKRVMREAYRLQKLPLENALAERNKSMTLFFIYTGKELPVFAEVYEKVKILLQRLVEQVQKHNA